MRRVWGNAPKDLVRVPGLFQVDTAIQTTGRGRVAAATASSVPVKKIRFYPDVAEEVSAIALRPSLMEWALRSYETVRIPGGG
jgi:hypothetical protein